MPDSKDREEFAECLLAQDSPPADKELWHKETLLKKLKRRIWLGKIIGGATYVAFFSIAFWAFNQGRYTNNLVHSICWGAVSMHILLWFLVYFLHMIYKLTTEVTDKNPVANKNQYKKTDRIVTIVAIFVFLFSTILLYFSFNLNSPLKATHLTVSILWASVFFLFWYPFGTASLVSKLWLEYKKMELDSHEQKKQ